MPISSRKVLLLIGIVLASALIGTRPLNYIKDVLTKKMVNAPTIAVIRSETSVAHELFYAEFQNCVTKDKRCNILNFTISNPNDSINVVATCKMALSSNADGIVCVGQVATLNTLELAKKSHSQKQIIFTGVDPIALGLPGSPHTLGGNITGVQSKSTNYMFNPIKLLLQAKPSAKKILLPYMTSSIGSQEYAKEIKKLCNQKGIEVTILPIDTMSNPLNHIASMLPGHDTLTYIEADGITFYTTALGKLASQHHVTLFATCFQGEKNAALSYSSTPACLAAETFNLVKEVIINKKKAGEIPIVDSTGFREFIIHPALFNEQDLKETKTSNIIARIKNDPELSSVHHAIKVY